MKEILIVVGGGIIGVIIAWLMGRMAIYLTNRELSKLRGEP